MAGLRRTNFERRKRPVSLSLCLVFFFFLTLVSCNKDKDTREPTIVHGQIKDHLSGDGLEEVKISCGYLNDVGQPIKVDSIFTGKDGQYDLRFGENNLYQRRYDYWKIWISKAGYQDVSLNAATGDITELNVGLYPE